MGVGVRLVDDVVVDVVIPSYNGMPFLQQAVESVLAQSHRRLRLHVIDDGSTDATGEYLEGLTDTRVHRVRTENRGLASSRNRGIELARGPYVAFLDADDFWYPKKLERQLAVIEGRSEIGLVHAYQHTIDRDGKILRCVDREARGDVFDQLLGGNCVTGSGSMVIVRREAFDRVGRFREDLAAGEDWEMWLRIASQYTFDCVPDYLAAVREWSGSMQQDALRMAKSLSRLDAIVNTEFALTPRQRARVARFCLLGAAQEYERVRGMRARWALLRYLLAVPSAAGDIRSWPLYSRLLLGRRTATLARRLATLSGVAWLDRHATSLRGEATVLAATGRERAATARLMLAFVLAPWRRGTLVMLRDRRAR